MKLRQLVLPLFAFTLLASFAHADDWPKWRGPDGDAISKEKDLLTTWPDAGLTQFWSADVGEGFSSPVAKDGKVYLLSDKGADETLTCFDANSGVVAWSQSAPSAWSGDYHGARTTPSIDGDRIYTFSGSGQLICRAIADGKQIWALNILEATGAEPLQWGTASSPLVGDKYVYVQGGKSPKPAGNPVCVAVDKATGKIAWKSQETGASGYAPPILAKAADAPALIVFAGAEIVAMDPETGKTLFTAPWPANYDVNASTPIFRDGKLFVTSGYGKGCGVFGVSATAFTNAWKNHQISGKFATPIYDAGVLYANTSDAHGGILVCVDWATGTLKWKIEDDKYKLGMGGSLIRFDDKLIGLSDKGILMLFTATPDKGDAVTQFDTHLGNDQVWTAPIIYDHKLYLKGTSKFVCYDLGSKPHAQAPAHDPAALSLAAPSLPTTQAIVRGPRACGFANSNSKTEQSSPPIWFDIVDTSPPPNPATVPATSPVGLASAGASLSTRPPEPAPQVDDHVNAEIPATTAASRFAATESISAPIWQNPQDFPAFHGGGPLLGVASDIRLPTTQRWAAQVADDGVEATPAIVDQVVYVPDMAGNLTALRLADGSVLWKFTAQNGLSTSPLVVDGRVFVGDLGGIFYGIDAAIGKQLWTNDSGAPIHCSANYTGTGILFANDNGHIACLDPATGKEIWVLDTGQRINSALAVRGNLAFGAGCDAQLHVLDIADGTESFSADLGALTGASPAVLLDRIAVGLDGGHIVCLSMDGGKPLWDSQAVHDNAMSYASPAVDAGLMIFGSRDRTVHALDAKTGEEKWEFETKGDVDGSPVISGGRVYVASKDRNLYALYLKTGAKEWEFAAPRPLIAGPAIGRGVLIQADSGGNVFCFEAKDAPTPAVASPTPRSAPAGARRLPLVLAMSGTMLVLALLLILLRNRKRTRQLSREQAS